MVWFLFTCLPENSVKVRDEWTEEKINIHKFEIKIWDYDKLTIFSLDFTMFEGFYHPVLLDIPIGFASC